MAKKIQKNIKTKKKSKKPFVDSHEIPTIYNTTNITLMARDPYWIYAYWEIAPSSIEQLKNQIGSELEKSVYTLRMYDVTNIDFNGSNANHWFDIDVGPYSNNWYINLWRDNVVYCAELGVRTPEGKFLALARSNVVTTPRAGSSDRSDMIWMEIKDKPSQPPFVIAQTHRETAKPVLPAKEAARKTLPPQTERSSERKIFLTEDDIRAYYSRIFPLVKETLPNQPLSGEPAGNDKKAPSAHSQNIYIKDGDILLENFLIRGLTRKEFLKRILSGASEELVIPGGASEFVREAGGASEREQKQRKFFFEIGTELIVYGRTEPDAEVWLGDKKIKLREDGTFTLRFALPDGKIPLNFVARSSDKKDKRAITTAVERTKTIHNP